MTHKKAVKIDLYDTNEGIYFIPKYEDLRIDGFTRTYMPFNKVEGEESATVIVAGLEREVLMFKQYAKALQFVQSFIAQTREFILVQGTARRPQQAK